MLYKIDDATNARLQHLVVISFIGLFQITSSCCPSPHPALYPSLKDIPLGKWECPRCNGTKVEANTPSENNGDVDSPLSARPFANRGARGSFGGLRGAARGVRGSLRGDIRGRGSVTPRGTPRGTPRAIVTRGTPRGTPRSSPAPRILRGEIVSLVRLLLSLLLEKV